MPDGDSKVEPVNLARVALIKPHLLSLIHHRGYPTKPQEEAVQTKRGPHPSRAPAPLPGWKPGQGSARNHGYERHDFLPPLTLLAHFEDRHNLYVRSGDRPRTNLSSVGLLPVELWIHSKLVARGLSKRRDVVQSRRRSHPGHEI